MDIKSLKGKVMLTMIRVRDEDDQTKSKELYECINNHFKEEYGYKDLVNDIYINDDEMTNDSYFIRFLNKYQGNEKYNQFIEDVSDAHLYLTLFD